MPLPLILVGVGAIALTTVAIGVGSVARTYKYRPDEGLDFLEHASSEDLNLLVEFLVEKTNENLTECPGYKEHYPDHRKYWKDIAIEIQTFGGHTVSNVYRGTGAPYREILYDVCDRMKVEYDKASGIQSIELNLLQKMLADTLEQIDPKDREDLLESLGEGNATKLKLSAGSVIAQQLLRSGGFSTYKWAIWLVHKTIGEVSKVVVGKGLPFAASQIVARATHLLIGPVGVALSSAWTVYDLHGPAYRVTVPSVLYIAMLRQKQLLDQEK